MTNGSEPHKVPHARLIACVHGRVQGVWFRRNTQVQAHRLGVSGTVRNLPDGTVRVVAEADRTRLETLLAWLRQGPEMAHVTGIDVEWTEPRGCERGFEIIG